MLISAEPGIEIQADARGWSALAPADLSAIPDSGAPVRVALSRSDEKAGFIGVSVRLGPQLALPSLVVSRLWIKAVQHPENDQATTASFWVETHEGPMVVALPAGSRWIRARLNSTELPENGVEVTAADEYRVRFPAATPSGPVLVSIDYVVPASATFDSWPIPRLLNGGVVQQTLCEVQVPPTRAGVGTPPGWIDENEWFWDGLIWRRRPWRTEAELSNWLTGGNPRFRVAEPSEKVEPIGRPTYLFSRVGPPTALRFPVLSRFTLLLLCSGPVLLSGLLVLARRPSARWLSGSLLTLAFVAGVVVGWNVLLLILQSATLGIALFLMALAMHWAIERRGRGRVSDDRALIVGTSPVSSTVGRVSAVGSDESTAIRVRPMNPSAISTTDHIVMTRTPGRPPDERSISDLDLR